MKSILKKKIIKRKYIKRLLVLSLLFILSVIALKNLENQHPPQEKPVVEKVEKKIETPKKPLTVAQKKKLFRERLVPAVQNAYAKLDKQYLEIKKLMNKDSKNKKIIALKEEYNAKTNHELLLKLKPHPKSVTLAQAAIESAWGTSRFFTKANNVFGVWSFNKYEPRIPASETRGEKTIYLKKYNSIEESVLDYYKILSKASPYHKFRVQNYTDPNPYILVKYLDKYSEKRAEYGKILISVIGHNKFTEYDEKFYPRPPKQEKLQFPVKPKKKEVEKPKVVENVSDSNETNATLSTPQDLNITKNLDQNFSDINSSKLDTNNTIK